MKFGITCTNEMKTFTILCCREGEMYKMNLGYYLLNVLFYF